MPRKPSDERHLSRRVMVNIVRDVSTSTPRVVWAHEIPILESIFQVVREVEPDTLDEGYVATPSAALMPYNKTAEANRKPSESLGLGFVFVGSAEAEYDRLANCYGRHPEVNQPWVENIYGRFSGGTFSNVIGNPELSDLPADQLRELVMAYGYSLPSATFDSTDAERANATAALKSFKAMTREQLVKLAGEVGVQLGA